MRSRPARWHALALLALCCGCEHEVFDHTPARADGGGPMPAPESCTPAREGEPCDDRDVCTPASSCRSGECVPGNAFETCVVADAERDFTMEQGGRGFYYGYYAAGMDADGSYDSTRDFREMEFCREGTWMPPGRCDSDPADPDYRWTRTLAWALQHPETRPTLELPVRRWVSDRSGPARLTVAHEVSGTGGDGTRALLLVDGVERWRHDSPGSDYEPVSDVIEVELEAGMLIEQLVHPLESSGDDTTYFALTVEGR
jgi:hypothetical protein